MPRPKGPPKIRRQFHLLRETDARIKASINVKTPNASAVIDEKFMPTAPEPNSTLTATAQRLVRLSSMRKGHQKKPRSVN